MDREYEVATFAQLLPWAAPSCPSFEARRPFLGFFGLSQRADRALPRNAYYRPHRHAGLTTHLILQGQLTIAYPDDASNGATKTTHGVGERLDVSAGMRHEVWIGPEGCTYVIGE